MIANPSKLHSVIIPKDKEATEGINGKVVKIESEISVLGIKLDNRLTLDICTGNKCKGLQIN